MNNTHETLAKEVNEKISKIELLDIPSDVSDPWYVTIMGVVYQVTHVTYQSESSPLDFKVSLIDTEANFHSFYASQEWIEAFNTKITKWANLVK